MSLLFFTTSRARSFGILGMLCCLYSGSALAQFDARTEGFISAGDVASYAGARTMFPLVNQDNSALFVEARVASSEAFFNYTLGTLWRQAGDNAAYGYYLGLDAKRSKTDHLHKQVTLGLERMGSQFDARALFFVPIDSAFQTGQFGARSEQKTEFSGNQLQQRTTGYRRGGYVLEETLGGAHVELGSAIPSATRLEMRAYMGAYGYAPEKMDSIVGGSLRLNAQPTNNFSVDISLLYDATFEGRMSMDLAWAFGRSTANNLLRTPRQRANDFFARAPALVETSKLKSDKRVVYQQGSADIGKIVKVDGAPANIVHIDNSTQVAAADADGSFEKPYADIAACNAGNCKTADAIYIHQGKSVVMDNQQVAKNQNASTPYMGNVTLNDNQQLLGDGISSGTFAAVATGVQPVIVGSAANTAATSIVAAGNNSTIEGVRLGWHFGTVDGATTKPPHQAMPAGGKMTTNAIEINDKTNVRISDVVITGFTQEGAEGNYGGTNFTNGIYLSGNASASVRNSIITANNHYGILLDGKNNQSQTLNLAGVNLTRNGTGLAMLADGANSQQKVVFDELKRNKVIMVNKIEASNNEGILMIGTNGAQQDLNLAKNTQIINNWGAGIYAHLTGGKNQIALNNSIVVGNAGGGVAVLNHGGQSTLNLDKTSVVGNIAGVPNFADSFNKTLDGTAVLAGNKRNQASGVGIYAYNNGQNAMQTINIKGAGAITAHGKGKAQIYLQSDNATGTAMQVLNVDKEAASGIDQKVGKVSGGQIVTDEGASIPQVAHFDGTADGVMDSHQSVKDQADGLLKRGNDGKLQSEQNLNIQAE